MKPSPEKSPQEVLAGLVERVTYHNAENGFCVLRAKVRGHRDLVTVVGHAATIAAGEWITASGEWINDRTHGQQFKARFLRTSLPTSVDGIEKYLSSGMIRGVGLLFDLLRKAVNNRLWRRHRDKYRCPQIDPEIQKVEFDPCRDIRVALTATATSLRNSAHPFVINVLLHCSRRIVIPNSIFLAGQRHTYDFVRSQKSKKILMPDARIERACKGHADRDIVYLFNGRHRFAWMRDHGAEALPVAVLKSEANEIAKLVGTNARACRVTMLEIPEWKPPTMERFGA